LTHAKPHGVVSFSVKLVFSEPMPRGIGRAFLQGIKPSLARNQKGGNRLWVLTFPPPHTALIFVEIPIAIWCRHLPNLRNIAPGRFNGTKRTNGKERNEVFASKSDIG
jgi:hypothetical protein